MSYYREIDTDTAPTLAGLFDSAKPAPISSGFDSDHEVLEQVVERLISSGLIKSTQITALIEEITKAACDEAEDEE